MSLLNENIGIKIKEVKRMTLGSRSMQVAPRPYHALALRLSGSVVFDFGNQKLTSGEGEIFFMPAYIGYVANYSGENEIIVIHFESPVALPPENLSPRDKDTVTSLFYKMNDMWKKRETGYYFSVLSVMCGLLSDMAKEQKLPLTNATEAAFDRAIKYMEEGYTDPEFTVNMMVERAAMSNTYFRKLFVMRFGTTPVKHLTEMRLSHAEKLLSSGTYTVSEAAERSGFSDVKYFTRLVHREFGVPPSMLYKRIEK